ncbi:MAG: zinc-finger domain-containing protein [Candidatus Midichloria sp.]|nr:zinc-finger domain-containing protein [Candidatus Midichloria sp.]
MAKNPSIVEKNIVYSKYVCCDGRPYYGHPKIYLEIGADKQTKCPYCGQVFVYTPKNTFSNKIKN